MDIESFIEWSKKRTVASWSEAKHMLDIIDSEVLDGRAHAAIAIAQFALDTCDGLNMQIPKSLNNGIS